MEMAIQEKDEVIENLQSKSEEVLRYIDKSEKCSIREKIFQKRRKSQRLSKFICLRQQLPY
ncbi:Hypothetical predicted protein, partial [Paramuricea clavata]